LEGSVLFNCLISSSFFLLIKLPHISFFSYGESLPVLEQGTSDPGGLGYAYENLAALIALNLQDVEIFVDNREEYIKKASKNIEDNKTSKGTPTIFISYHHADQEWLESLKTHLAPLARYRELEIWDDTKIKAGREWKEEIQNTISHANVAVI
jgi:ABC-type Fe3+-hydroxamate transport system substrate-binding protein